MNTEEFLAQAGTIALCGSTRIYDAYTAYIIADRLLTLSGWTVLSCGQFEHSYNFLLDNSAEGIARKRALHFFKILQSDAICVINGSSYNLSKLAQIEIEFAKQHNRSILHFESTGPQTGKFELKLQRDLIRPTFAEFLAGEGWHTFTLDNPILRGNYD